MSVLIVPVIGLLAALSPHWALLLAADAAAGVALGLGLPAAVALLSETTPKAYRIILRAASDAFFDLGFVYAALLAGWQDSELQELHWRRLLLWNVLPVVLIGLPALALLRESPLFLAAGGYHGEAREALAAVRALNCGDGAGVADMPLPEDPAAGAAVQAEEAGAPLQSAFSRRFFEVTLTLAHAAFFLSVLSFAGTSLQLRADSPMMDSFVGSGQMVLGGMLDLLALAVSAVLTRQMSRATALAVALGGGAATVWCFGLAGGATSRSAAMEFVYQFGALGFYWVPAMGFVSLYQLAVEVYPTSMAATGAGIVLASGRLGAVVAPDLLAKLEAVTGHWSFCCYFLALACGLGAVKVYLCLRREDTAEEYLREARPLLYGTAQSKA